MKRKIFSKLLMGAFLIASVSMFVSCKDYDDDISKNAADITELQSKLESYKSDLTNQLTQAQSALDAKTTALETALSSLRTSVDGKADKADVTNLTNDVQAAAARVSALETQISSIDAALADAAKKADVEALATTIATVSGNLDDLSKLVGDEEAARIAADKNLQDQIEALKAYGEELDKLAKRIEEVAAAAGDKTAIEAIQKDINETKNSISTLQGDIKALQEAIKDFAQASDVESLKTSLNELSNKVSAVEGNINVLTVLVNRKLSSLVLRPDTYYGGIEGISVYTFVLPEEKNNPEKAADLYHYFDRVGTLNISDYGKAQYHVNPTTVDLSNFTIDFYNWTANVKEPAATERVTPTRSGVDGISPVYGTTDDLLKASSDNLKDGILTIPFKADAKVIEDRLEKGIATIASLSLTKKGGEVADTTVNSDYAIVVPEYGYGLLIGDNTFPVTTRHLDQIGYDGGDVNSSNLHRSFSFLALATTSPTHTIKYDGSFDITAVLESRYVPVKEDYDNEITDTVSGHTAHLPIAKWNGTTLNIADDGDASIDKAKVVTLKPEKFNELGFKYEIQPVNYTLGTNKTGETVHLELIEDENGHVIAYPRNVTADGQTIKGQTANAASVGRQPIVCIMVKDSKDRIVSFAYMKFLITQEVVTPEAKEADFDIKDIWVNCKETGGKVTWSEIEYHIYDQLLGGFSKKDFDNNYIFDYYQQSATQVDVNGATYNQVTRVGIQYDGKAGKRIDPATAFGSISEEWNESAQGVEDATTHIIKWWFTAAQLKDKAEALKNAGKLEDKGDYYANVDPIVTWVRYAHKAYDPTTDAPVIGKNADKGNPAIWVKLTIPAGEFHVAKGEMGANKILTYWYDLNSKTNAESASNAYEVRVNVPVPVPETSASEATIGYSIVDNATALDIRYDNLLEKANDPIAKRTNKDFSEFTKNLKDFFIGGKLSASVKDAKHFSSITGMKLGCEFILPSTTVGNATFNAGKNNGIDNSWVVTGYTGAKYTLILNADRTKVQIKAKNSTVYPTPVDLVTLNYDENATVADRQITVVNYVNGEDQDDILNYKTHNELGELETFTAYINIKAIDACAPVYWDNMWFNVRFLRPLDLEDPKQALVPDAPNDWHEIDLTDALIVKDWREYYGDRKNRTQGKDVTEPIPGVGTVKAFDFAYYQVELDIADNLYYTDANLGTNSRSSIYDLGVMPRVQSEADAVKKNFIKTSDVPNLKLEKVSATKLRYLNNSGVTGGFHVFIPITMTYVYGFQQVRQTKWVTVGVTASVEQAMIEN